MQFMTTVRQTYLVQVEYVHGIDTADVFLQFKGIAVKYTFLEKECYCHYALATQFNQIQRCQSGHLIKVAIWSSVTKLHLHLLLKCFHHKNLS